MWFVHGGEYGQYPKNGGLCHAGVWFCAPIVEVLPPVCHYPTTKPLPDIALLLPHSDVNQGENHPGVIIRRYTILAGSPESCYPMKKIYPSPLTKAQIINTLAEDTSLSRKDVAAILNCLGKLIRAHVRPRSCGLFRLPGILRISVVRKPTAKAMKGVPNPFRPGETMDIPAKPASRKLGIYPLKGLKDMVA